MRARQLIALVSLEFPRLILLVVPPPAPITRPAPLVSKERPAGREADTQRPTIKALKLEEIPNKNEVESSQR